jgi:hypothetical protein
MSKINGDKKRSNLWSRKRSKMREKVRALRQELNPPAKPAKTTGQ